MEKELCWLITNKCNESCAFCHKFENEMDLTLSENKEILDHIIASGINEIVWSGGEALLYPDIYQILKHSKNKGIKNTLITNGQTYNALVFEYLDEIVLSLDSLDSKTNKLVGRGKNHFVNWHRTLRKIQRHHPNLIIRVNTVFTKYNSSQGLDIKLFLENNRVNKWRIFKFAALRGRAIKSKSLFELDNGQFEAIVGTIGNSNMEIQIRQNNDYNDLYLLITPGGNLYITDTGGDKYLGQIKDTNIIKKIFDSERC